MQRENKEGTVMKKIILSVLALGICSFTFAQKKKVQFEAGINYPLGFGEDANKENHIGLYFNGTYNFSESPLNVKLRLSYESYTVVMNQYANSPFNGRSLSLIPSLNYNFPMSEKSSFYAGLGAGISADNTDSGVFNDGCEMHFVVAPQIGAEFFRHLNLSAQYNITQKDFCRLMFGVGYVF